MQPTPPFSKALLMALLAVVAVSPQTLAASGLAFNTLVVVNTNSENSVELGEYYAEVHAIPSHHICSLGIDTNWVSLTSNQFYSLVHGPITNHIAAENLDGQIDYVVLCQDFPTRIENKQGLSASLFYGPRYAGTSGCNPPTAFTTNAYYRAERAFCSADDWNATNGFITFHLMAFDLPTAKEVADRGAAAQASRPPASINLYFYGDQYRGVREQRFPEAQFAFTALPGLPVSCSAGTRYSIMSGITNATGYHDGFSNVRAPVFNDLRTNNTWLPGSYADHLTSWGGMITNLTNATGQSTVLDWLDIGATASYGTVVEPCAYLEKFPAPMLGFYYARGFTIGEAYAMSVEAPYQGLFAGDPLAAPFAAPPVVDVTSHEAYQIVTGTVPLQVSATARSNGVPAAIMDLYIDDYFHTNLVTLAPTPGNQLFVVVDGITNTATVATNDTLFDAVAALAVEVNADTNQIVSATAAGDRLELIYELFDNVSDNLPVSASVAQGEAPALTVGVGLAATNLHPSIYPARKTIYLEAHDYYAGANAGDSLTCIITLTNGVAITNTLVATNGERTRSILNRLEDAISTNTTLLATNGVAYERLGRLPSYVYTMGAFFARTPGPDGYPIQIDYSVSAMSPSSGLKTNTSFVSIMDDYANDLRPHASVLFHVTPTNGVLTAGYDWDTTSLSDDVYFLDFIARDGSAVAAPARTTLPLVICNSSPQLLLQGTNGAVVTNGEPASLAKGTDFGPVDLETSVTNTFSLRNNGTAPLAISGWTTNGAGAGAFQILGIPPTIQIGGVSNFNVVFTPATNQFFQASLSIDSDAILDQTNLLFAGTGVVYELIIASDHGTATPAVGAHSNLTGGTMITNSMSAPAPAGGTQLVCTGWAMAGNAPLSGSTTSFVMTITNDAFLTWLWTTNYWLDTAAGPNGAVDVADAWQPRGVTTQITAHADLYYTFTNWSGDTASTSNPLNLLMDAPKSVQANFTALLAAYDTPQWWLAQFGWTNDFDAAATNDVDLDGYFTWQEYISDTIPTNGASFFPPLQASGTVSSLQLEIDPTSTGRHYHVEVGSPITDPGWTNVTNAAGTGGAWSPEIIPPGTNLFFYRGRVTLPPE